MKGKVIKKFRDKITRSVYAAGDTIDRDAARIAEMNKAKGGPFIEVMEEPGNESEGEPATSETEGEPDTAGKTTRKPRSKKTKE